MHGLVVSFTALVGLLALCVPIARWSHLPTATVQFVVGAIAVSIAVGAGYDTGLRYQQFHDLVFMVFLPILVFEAAQSLEWAKLRDQLVPVLLLAIVGMLVTTVLVGTGVYFGIGYPTAFPVAAALLTGVLLAATDPAAVTSQPSRSGAPRSRLLLEGESLFNDATAVSLFTVILAVALTGNSTDALASDALLTFGREFAGGIALGAALGASCRWLTKRTSNTTHAHWLALLAALGGYHLGQAVHVSGVMVCLAAGLFMPAADGVWRTLANTASGMLFLLMGATVTASMFSNRWLAMIIAIAAVVAARLISMWLVLGLLNPLQRGSQEPFSVSERTGLGLLGMRGAITLALALMLPVELPYWWTIQSIAYGVVMFDLLITAPLAPYIIRKFS